MPESIETIAKLVSGKIFETPSNTRQLSQLNPEECFSESKNETEDSLLLLDAMPLQDARPGDLTLVDSIQHLSAWLESPARVAFAPITIAEELFQKSHEPIGTCSSKSKCIVGVSNLHEAFEKAIRFLRGERVDGFTWSGVHSTAVIHPTAIIAPSVQIGPYVTIGAGSRIGERTTIHANVQIMGNCVIGSDCEIFPSAVLYDGTILHERVILHASSILGAYGFGYRQSNHQHVRTSQLGWVEIENDVEIGAGTTVDRGTYGPTRIGRGTKLDNQIQIGHNVHIGEHNLLCAQVGIAGSSSTGNYVVLGGQVGVRDHIRLGDRSMAAAQSGIANNVPEGTSVLGTPALPQREATQIWIHSQRLPDIRKQIKALESQMKLLNEQVETLQSPQKLTTTKHRAAA